MSDSLWPHESQNARPPCPSPTPGVHPNPRPSSWWCQPAISSYVVPFSSYPQSFSASESFPISQLFAWGGQSTGVSALASVLPMNTQGWSPLGWTGWISLQSKGLSRVFSNTTIQKHQFFGTQLSSQFGNFKVCRLTWTGGNFLQISERTGPIEKNPIVSCHSAPLLLCSCIGIYWSMSVFTASCVLVLLNCGQLIVRLSTEELMLLNCGFGEGSWKSLGLQGDPTSQS